MKPVARIVAGLIQLDLAHLEHIHLHRPVRRRQQDRGRLDRRSTVSRPEDFELRHRTEQAVDDVEVDGGSVGFREP
jgi:hypothetical protein